jgi:formylglycine-generating enzyme required for sulfatase activity
MQAQTPKLTITKQQGQNQFYEETLSEAVKFCMMLIPSGKFLMGSPKDEPERSDSESPQHEVAISQFFMAEYPVTQAQWKIVAAMPQVERELKTDPSRFKGDNLPVEQVSWYDAVEFCTRLTIHTNREYRLPSEAEWEYACRAGTTTPFHFGETIVPELANYDGNYTYNNGSKGEYLEKTTPVDHFGLANAFGLSDMYGNVWEWCADYWHNNYEGAPSDGSARLKGSKEEFYILRGGSWINDPRGCRSAYRLWYAPDVSYSYLGFRVCCSSPRSS